MPQRDFEELLYDVGGNLVTEGSSNAYELETAQSINDYYKGLWLRAKANHTNDGPSTLSVNDIAAADIFRADGTALTGGEIVEDVFFDVVYDADAEGFLLQATIIENVTNAQLADMAGWTIKLRNNSASGDPQDVQITDLTAISSPADTDVLMAALSTDELRKIPLSLFGIPSISREWTRQQNFDQVTLSDGANISWNLDTQQCAVVTLGGNRTLDNPSNMRAGSTYILLINQDGTGNRTLTFDTAYRFVDGENPELDGTANSQSLMACYSDGSNLICSVTGPILKLPPSGAFLQQANQTGAATQFTFASQNLGTAHAERVIVCAINASTSPTDVTSVTINGVTATSIIELQDTNEYAAIFAAVVPTGTSGSVVVNFTGSTTDCSIALFRLVGLSTGTGTPTATATATNTDDALASTINVSANGFVIGCGTFDNDTTVVTTVGVTENWDLDIGSARAVGGLFSNGATAETGRTVSFDGGATNAAGVWAAFR